MASVWRTPVRQQQHPPQPRGLGTPNTANSTLMSPGLPACRICCLRDLGEGKNRSPDDLVEPCQCTGSVAWVHKGCLLQWIQTRPKVIKRAGAEPMYDLECEICHGEYNVRTRTTFNWSKLCSGDSFTFLMEFICVSLFIAALVTLIHAFQGSMSPGFRIVFTCLTSSPLLVLLTVILRRWKDSLWSREKLVVTKKSRVNTRPPTPFNNSYNAASHAPSSPQRLMMDEESATILTPLRPNMAEDPITPMHRVGGCVAEPPPFPGWVASPMPVSRTLQFGYPTRISSGPEAA